MTTAIAKIFDYLENDEHFGVTINTQGDATYVSAITKGADEEYESDDLPTFLLEIEDRLVAAGFVVEVSGTDVEASWTYTVTEREG